MTPSLQTTPIVVVPFITNSFGISRIFRISENLKHHLVTSQRSRRDVFFTDEFKNVSNNIALRLNLRVNAIDFETS